MKTTKPTIEQHAEHGQLARDAYLAISRLSAFAAGAYGKTSPEVRAANAAAKSVMTYRSKMDSRVLRDHNPPHGSEAERTCLRCYYPGTQDSAGLTVKHPEHETGTSHG